MPTPNALTRLLQDNRYHEAGEMVCGWTTPPERMWMSKSWFLAALPGQPQRLSEPQVLGFYNLLATKGLHEHHRFAQLAPALHRAVKLKSARLAGWLADHLLVHVASFTQPEKGDLLAYTLDMPDLFERFVQAGICIDTPWRDSNAALMTSIEQGYQKLPVVEFLLQKGANPNQQHRSGYSALHRACEVGCNDVVRVLLEHGANPNSVQPNGWTPLMVAAGRPPSARREHDLFYTLCHHGADPLARVPETGQSLETVCHPTRVLHYRAFIAEYQKALLDEGTQNAPYGPGKAPRL